MTIPVHSVKHVKANYRRYQIMALISTIITVAAVFLAAIVSFQLSRVSKRSVQQVSAQQTASSLSLTAQVKSLQEQLTDMQKQVAAGQATIQTLEGKVAQLQSKLTAARKAAEERKAAAVQAPQADGSPEAPSGELPPADQSTVQERPQGAPAPAEPPGQSQPAPDNPQGQPEQLQTPPPQTQAPQSGNTAADAASASLQPDPESPGPQSDTQQ